MANNQRIWNFITNSLGIICKFSGPFFDGQIKSVFKITWNYLPKDTKQWSNQIFCVTPCIETLVKAASFFHVSSPTECTHFVVPEVFNACLNSRLMNSEVKSCTANAGLQMKKTRNFVPAVRRNGLSFIYLNLTFAGEPGKGFPSPPANRKGFPVFLFSCHQWYNCCFLEEYVWSTGKTKGGPSKMAGKFWDSFRTDLGPKRPIVVWKFSVRNCGRYSFYSAIVTKNLTKILFPAKLQQERNRLGVATLCVSSFADEKSFFFQERSRSVMWATTGREQGMSVWLPYYSEPLRCGRHSPS